MAARGGARGLGIGLVAELGFGAGGAGFGAGGAGFGVVAGGFGVVGAGFGAGGAVERADERGNVPPGCRDLQSQLPLFPSQVQVQHGAAPDERDIAGWPAGWASV